MAHAGNALGGEGLVQLMMSISATVKQVLAITLGTAGTGPIPMMSGSTLALASRPPPPSAFCPNRPLFRRHHDDGHRSIVNLAGVTGGHAAIFLSR
jgi:hypothetical protein